MSLLVLLSLEGDFLFVVLAMELELVVLQILDEGLELRLFGLFLFS